MKPLSILHTMRLVLGSSGPNLARYPLPCPRYAAGQLPSSPQSQIQHWFFTLAFLSVDGYSHDLENLHTSSCICSI